MQLQDAYAIIVTDKLTECRDFYTRWLGFRVVTPRPIEMREGTLIEYRLTLHRLPISWLTRIEEWVPGERFVDADPGAARFWQVSDILGFLPDPAVQLAALIEAIPEVDAQSLRQRLERLLSITIVPGRPRDL